MIGIYKITSPSGRVYIGQSWNIERRFKQYKKSLGAKQIKLFNSISKYGIESHVFEIIHEFLEEVDQKTLDDHEILYWNQYKNLGIDVLNTREPGKGGKHSEETKDKISLANKGKKHSQEEIDKMSKALKGRVFSEETRRKISEAKKGTKYKKKL